MQLFSNDFKNNEALDPKFAFGRPDGQGKMTFSDNLNPHLAWSDIPEGVKSFILLCLDPDVPAIAVKINEDGVSIPSNVPRTEFFHWAVANIPVDVTEIPQGACSNGVKAGGKQETQGFAGSLQGRNDYTKFFAENEEMAGDYFGYDGPCPPWNDERPHHYRFSLYALDVEELNLPEAFTGDDLLMAMSGHILDGASLTGTYTLNKNLLDAT